MTPESNNDDFVFGHHLFKEDHSNLPDDWCVEDDDSPVIDEFGRSLVWFLPEGEQDSHWHGCQVVAEDLKHFGYFYDGEKLAEYRHKKQKLNEELEKKSQKFCNKNSQLKNTVEKFAEKYKEEYFMDEYELEKYRRLPKEESND